MRLSNILIKCLFGLASFNLAYGENLHEIYQSAVEKDPIMQAADAKLRSSREITKSAKGSLLPQISAEYNYTQNFIDNPQFKQSDDLSLVLQQTLFNLNSWYSFKGTEKLSSQAEAEFVANQQDLIKRTIESYLMVLRAQDNLESSKSEEAAIKQQLTQIQKRFDVGLIAITDVHESQAAYDLSKVRRLQNEGAVETAYESVGLLTGHTPVSIAKISDNLPIVSPEPLDREAWVNIALNNNNQLKQAKAASESAQFNLKAQKSNYMPVVTARAVYGQGKTTDVDYGFGAPFDQTNDKETLSLIVSVPLYNGGIISSQNRKALADYEQTSANVASIEIGTKQKTRALHIAVLMQVQQVAAEKQVIASAQSALEAIQAGYNVGTRTIVDVLNGQRILFAAQRDYANARYDYIMNLFQLKQIAGILSPADIENLNQWVATEEISINTSHGVTPSPLVTKTAVTLPATGD